MKPTIRTGYDYDYLSKELARIKTELRKINDGKIIVTELDDKIMLHVDINIIYAELELLDTNFRSCQ